MVHVIQLYFPTVCRSILLIAATTALQILPENCHFTSTVQQSQTATLRCEGSEAVGPNSAAVGFGFGRRVPNTGIEASK
jgi:hypothetical protein